MTGFRGIILLFAALAGFFGVYTVSEVFKADAKSSWEAEGNQVAQWLSGTLLGWLEESYAPLSGLAALSENSESVTESEFLNAFDGLEARATAFFLDAAAMYRPVGEGTDAGWQVAFTSDLSGVLSHDAILEDWPALLSTLNVAHSRPGEFIIGPPIGNNDDANTVSPVALSTFDSTGDAVVVGLVNYDALVKGLFDLHVPPGLALELTARFPALSDLGKDQSVIQTPRQGTLHEVTTRTVSAGAELSITWLADNRFSGGPEHELANFMLITGVGGVLVAAFFIGFLLQRNEEISRRVEEATAEIVAAKDSAERERQRMRDAIEALEVGFVIYDANERLVINNRRYAEMYPEAADLMVQGAKFRDILAKGCELTRVNERYGQTVEEWVEGRLESHRALNKGTVQELEDRWILINDFRTANGETVSIRTDITELKIAERTLEERTNLLQGVLSAMTQGVVAFDRDLKLIAWNDVFLDIRGYPTELASVGTDFAEFMEYDVEHGEFSRNDPEFDVQMQVERARKFEMHAFERQRPDGRHIEVRGGPIPGGGFVSTYADITERKLAETQISKLSAAVEQSSAAIVITDPEGLIEYVNPAFVRASGYTPEDVVGYPFRILKPGVLDEDTYTDLWDTIKGGQVWQGEYLNRKKSGEPYWEDIALSPLLGENGEITNFVAIKEDVTARKEAEQELRTARDAAEAASQAKADFLASMSHEIRTPMNGIVGMADLLSQSELDADQRIMLDTVRDSGNSLLTIINDILDFSKIEAGKLDIESIPMSLNDVLEGAAATMSPNASRKGARIITFVDPDIPQTLLGDPVRLRQIVFNLTGNAVKFSEEGEVVVRADAVDLEADPVRIKISVIDQGIGITEEAQGKLFEAFSQAESSTTRRFGGTGLGLAICKRLTDLMGGEITVESRIGSGSTFAVEILLRLADQDAAQTEDADLSGVRALCVSDVDTLRDSMVRYLRHWSVEAEAAASEDDAADRLAKAGDVIDVVVLDLGLNTERQQAAMKRFAAAGRTFVVLSQGQRRSARIEKGDCVTLDGNPLRHMPFVNAVAVAAGRASPLVKPDIDDGVSQDVVALSVEDALAQGTLILLAEDNMTNQQVIGRQLTKLGYTCEMADDGKFALDAWGGKDYALLLTDCHMPRMDGFELTAAVRADEEGSGKRSPIIAVTANALEGEAERCIAAGMDDYLSKPLAMNDLKAALRKWMPNAVSQVVEEKAEATAQKPATPDDASPPDAVPKAVEPKFLRETFGDDDELIKEILLDFVAPAEATVGEINDAFDSRDAAALGAAAHKLKSSSRSVGAEVLADLCADLEKSGKSADWPSIEDHHPKLASAIAAVTSEIESL